MPAGGRAPSDAVPAPLADEPQAALVSLCLIARMHHVAADPAHLAHQLGWSPRHVPGVSDLLLAARAVGLRAKSSRSTGDRLALVPLPALAFVRDSDGAECVVVLAQCDGQRVLHQDPSGATHGGRPAIEPLDAFVARWTGELILVTSRASLAGSLAKFDFSWFIPSLVKYRRLFGEVLLVSLFLQLFALVSPLFFQVVMDKVLVHRGLTTLDVLVIGLSVVVVFESALTLLRTYVMGRGYGTESVQENDATVGNTDVLSFLPGISDDQIWLRHVGNNLEVSIIGTDDKAVLQNWYLGNRYHVEQFQTSAGKTLLDSKVQDLVNAMASFAPPGIGQTTLPPPYQSALLPVIAADWGP
ncbi:MAG: cysteine peptidase family C39 domain-containing protein [Caldimonas sp.]